MRLPVRLLILALGAGLVVAGTAQAAIVGAPEFTAPPFTKAVAGAGNAVALTVNYLGPLGFITTPTPADNVTVGLSDADVFNPPPNNVTGIPKGGSIPFLVSNGHRYNISVSACQQPGACTSLSPTLFTQTTGQTRADATPPTGTVQIDGGAVATNNANATLSLTATDPLIDGIPGSSSGVTQVAVDNDGDGSYPCGLIILNGDTSGCAQDFAPTVPATLTAGDGLKTVGVMFGDGAREITAPCPPGIFCAIIAGPKPILGNASAPVTDTIILDTVKPIAQAALDRSTIQRGETVSFDASGSTDQNPAIASGVDPTTAVWNFKDGTPPSTGQRVTHVFNTVGTFVGQMVVSDKAGNQSDPKTFTVTVNPRPGDATVAGGGGSVGTITAQGSPLFAIDQVKVKARYVKSKLAGSIVVAGTSTQAGALQAQIIPAAKGGKVRRLTGTVGLGAFTTTLKLPADLLPGTYKLAFVGPGGTFNSSLKLVPPREGVLKSGKVTATKRRSVVRFTLAAQPVKALRGRITVTWVQGSRTLGLVKVKAGTRITAGLPAGAASAKGKVLAQLRAGGIVVGAATGRLP